MVTMAIEHTHTQQDMELNQRRHLGEQRGPARKVWRRLGAEQDKVLDSPNNHCNGPFAQVGEQHHPKPAAMSTHSTMIHNSKPPDIHTTIMEHSPCKDQEQHSGYTATEERTPQPSRADNSKKLKVTIPEDLFKTLRANCAAKAAVSLLGRIHGKHPGLKALMAWAKATLHPSLTLLSLKANNLFEVTFEREEGRLHALRQADLKCEAAAIFFASWRPHFDSREPQAIAQLDCPVWVQVVGLCQVLREEAFLRTLGEQLGQVISIDTSDAYRAKLLGPWIRLLVQDLNNLPQKIVIPRLDGEGEVEYELEFSGLPDQCGRCRARDHQVRHCPKLEPDRTRRVTRNRPRARKGRTEQSPLMDVCPGPPSTREKGECSTSTQPTAKEGPPTLQRPQDPNIAIGRGTSIETMMQERSLVKEQLTFEEDLMTPYVENSQTELLRQDTAREASFLAPRSKELSIQDPIQEPEAGNDMPREPDTTAELTPQPAGLPQAQEEEGDITTLLPDDINFPRLQTPMRLPFSASTSRKGGHTPPTPRVQTPPMKDKPSTPTFVWGPKPAQKEMPLADETQLDLGKSKSKTCTQKGLESAPITRQGYRLGRLVEDFWIALGIPNPPSSTRKTLQVIPFLAKDPLTEQAEYLVDPKTSPPSAVTHVHIAELLAGIPWTSSRARQHVVNEISQALHKVLIFNNNTSNLFQKWQQGTWFASWVEEAEGDHV